jgi:hypothetical protein
VPEPVIRRVLEAGRLSASAANRQPWHFVVVQERDALRRLGELVRSGPYITEAAVAIAVVVERTPKAVSDASRAIQSMLLTAWAEGVGGNWTGFGKLEDVRDFLGVPADLDLLAVLPLGYRRVSRWRRSPIGNGGIAPSNSGPARNRPTGERATLRRWSAIPARGKTWADKGRTDGSANDGAPRGARRPDDNPDGRAATPVRRG